MLTWEPSSSLSREIHTHTVITDIADLHFRHMIKINFDILISLLLIVLSIFLGTMNVMTIFHIFATCCYWSKLQNHGFDFHCKYKVNGKCDGESKLFDDQKLNLYFAGHNS